MLQDQVQQQQFLNFNKSLNELKHQTAPVSDAL